MSDPAVEAAQRAWSHGKERLVCFLVAETADRYFTERTGWDEVARWPCPTAKLIYREDEL